MTIKEYREILENTTYYDNHQTSMSVCIREIIDIANKMKYENVLQTVSTILEQHGTVKTARITDDSKVSYIIIDTSPEVRQKIRNLKFHVQNQQECDISEKILNLGR